MSYPEALEAAIVATARHQTSQHPWLFEDAAQEARIAVWECWQHRPGDVGYAMVAAKHAAMGVSMGTRRLTGAPSRRGKGDARVTVETMDPADLPERGVVEEPACMAYHRPQIAAALSNLTERQRGVVADVMLGVPLPQNSSEWRGRIRPRLAWKLRHLKGATT